MNHDVSPATPARTHTAVLFSHAAAGHSTPEDTLPAPSQQARQVRFQAPGAPARTR